MAKKLFILSVMVFLGCAKLLAQYNSNRNKVWVMGNRIGVDFNLSPPGVFTSNMQNSLEGCASVCDTSGQLLFYTNGTNVWTASGTIMPSGTNFNGGSGTTYSTTQGALIVPDPGNEQRYYLFSLTSMNNSKLFCDVVDMSLNTGLGDIDTGFSLHHSVIADGLTEKMTAIAGCQENVWIIVHVEAQAAFRVYELSASGLNLNYLESGWGTMPPPSYSGGVIKAAPLGDRLVACNTYNYGTGIEIYDFDKTTGALSNAHMLDSGAYYGASFSPRGNILYGQKVNSGEIYQFDLISEDPGVSQQLLGPSRPYTDLKIGTDGKVYFISKKGTATKYLGCIEQPDIYGPDCDFRDSLAAIAFENNAYINIMYGLPHDIVTAVPADRTVHTLVWDTLFCQLPATGLLLEAAPGNYDYQWNDGSSGEQKTVDQSGTYWVKYKMESCGLGTDTFRIQVNDMPQLQIMINGNTLSVSPDYAIYQWFQEGMPITGTQQASCLVSENGWYSIEVQDQTGCSDSAGVYVTGITSLGEHTAQRSICLYPNPAKEYVRITDGDTITGVLRTLDGRFLKRHSFSEGQLSIDDLAPGSYLLYLYNAAHELLKVAKVLRME